MKRDATSKQNKSIPTKPRGWIKALRIIIYVVTIVGLAIGIGLIKSAALSSSFADGTHEIKLSNGYAIFIPSVIVLTLNIFWGILRWFLRGHIEHWRAGQVIGKLIGGGFWRTLLIVPLFLVALFTITPLISNAIKSNLLAEAAAFVPFNPDYSTHRLEYLNEHFDELNPEDIYTELQELTFTWLEFGTDEDAERTNISTANTFISTPVYARTSNVTTLNKVKLSSGGNFVIFYTDRGDDAIKESDAETVGEYLEDIVKAYKNNLGLSYQYTKRGEGATKSLSMMTTLAANGFPSNIMDTAMPVYIASPFRGESNVLASYAGEVWGDIVTKLVTKLGTIPLLNKYVIGMDDDMIDMLYFYDSAPSFPFINIDPVNIGDPSLKSVTAHELGHHYDDIHRFTKYGNYGAGDSFIKETIANWMAINVVSDNSASSVINGGHYNDTYLKEGTNVSVKDSVADFPGYPPYSFLQNYSTIVPNATEIMLDASYHGNALNYLYEKAGTAQFSKVMTTLAEKNLTGDYDGKLVNYTTPKGEELYCSDLCDHTYTIAPASTQYLYFTPDEYQNTNATFTGTDIVQASLLARTNEGWQILSHASPEVTIDFTDTDYHRYLVVALAVSNSGVASDESYKLGVIKSDLEDIVAKEGNYEFDLPSGDILIDLGDNCYGVDVDRAFGYLNQFMSLGSELLGALSQHDASGSIANSKAEYDANMDVARENMNDARTALEGYKVSICLSYIAPGQSFDAVRSRLERSLGSGFTFGEGQADSLRLSTIVSFNAFSRQAKAYVLGSDGSDMGLLTVNIEPK